ncbi:uncharacterized protein B0I36DRAFT_8509 [Microdochium trichocladiopsis]|uniref:Secreted protein n=1 Tax=Microdochium trichocladiopsis TaxID=1682393 RepID=A0A9P9BW68_9PEZI|nr:uncharacterized protein B0I36DRAFT_8509 [Microdochium trichocladiopsis]KAH7040305.1 hypothetical protein B0I36DRAFT_8509 [Microdochium trichocladiopsis]
MLLLSLVWMRMYTHACWYLGGHGQQGRIPAQVSQLADLAMPGRRRLLVTTRMLTELCRCVCVCVCMLAREGKGDWGGKKQEEAG